MNFDCVGAYDMYRFHEWLNNDDALQLTSIHTRAHFHK